ncbi:hypothetical protein [Streptomyces sp. NBC_00239]|uniref:hypothetical protein n=1 Tax=Streptomyces sp. NBC_00239 TaxID=2903640 RepID=UPI002E2DCE45|nr:hypothetical protein [Streptomyces sp. NBC_00239]
MTPQPAPEDRAAKAERRRTGVAAFATGTAASLACFAFLPGLPHVIDWGAALASLATGWLSRRAWQSHMTRKHAIAAVRGHEKAPGHGE